MGWVTEERRRMPMTVFVSVTEVRRALSAAPAPPRTSTCAALRTARRESAACSGFR